MHQKFSAFTADLNRLYLETPALYRADYDRQGFTWLDIQTKAPSVYAFLREAGQSGLIAVFNFSEQAVEHYTIDLPGERQIREAVLYSAWQKYGGTEGEEGEIVSPEGELRLAPFSALYLELDEISNN